MFLIELERTIIIVVTLDTVKSEIRSQINDGDDKCIFNDIIQNEDFCNQQLETGVPPTLGYKHKPSTKALLSKLMTERYTDPAARAKTSAATKKAMQRQDVKARHKAGMKKSNKRPEVRANEGAASRKALARPEVKANLIAAMIGKKNALMAMPTKCPIEKPTCDPSKLTKKPTWDDLWKECKTHKLSRTSKKDPNDKNCKSDKQILIDRIKLQMEDSQKIKHADFVIYNNSSTSELFNEIDKIIKTINE